MNTYNVHIYREMRLFFPGISAHTPEEAAALAAEKRTFDAACVEECEGETLAALVDVAGDETFERSRMVSLAPVRDAAPEMLNALDMAAIFLGNTLSGDATAQRVHTAILAAIAKARGAALLEPHGAEDGMNAQRAAWASAALASFCAITGQHADAEADEAIGDLMCDLLHVAQAKGFDPQMVLLQAMGHYAHEVRYPEEESLTGRMG